MASMVPNLNEYRRLERSVVFEVLFLRDDAIRVNDTKTIASEHLLSKQDPGEICG